MRLKLVPQSHQGETTRVEVIDENTLSINGEVYEIPADLVSLNPVGPILSGYRDEDGILWVEVLYQYSPDDRPVWETLREDGTYRGSAYEDWQGVVS